MAPARLDRNKEPVATSRYSQRADFCSEVVNVETLYRRPIFNTRDEPHADAAEWARLHVICGESNLISTATKLKFALTKAALSLIETGEQPSWPLTDPVRSLKVVSRDVDGEGRIDLEGSSWTTARQVIESYIEPFLARPSQGSDALECEIRSHMELALELLEARFSDQQRFARSVDWAAKRGVLAQYAESEGKDWGDRALQALDLEYHRIDGEGGLFHALLELDEVDADPPQEAVFARTIHVFEGTRARARSIAVKRFRDDLATASWGSLTFKSGKAETMVQMPPDRDYPDTLDACSTVEDFIMKLEAR